MKRIRHSATGLLVAEMASQEGLQAHTHARSQAAPTSTSKYLCKRAKFQGIPAGTESGAPEVTALERCIGLEARQVTRSRSWLVLLYCNARIVREMASSALGLLKSHSSWRYSARHRASLILGSAPVRPCSRRHHHHHPPLSPSHLLLPLSRLSRRRFSLPIIQPRRRARHT